VPRYSRGTVIAAPENRAEPLLTGAGGTDQREEVFHAELRLRTGLVVACLSCRVFQRRQQVAFTQGVPASQNHQSYGIVADPGRIREAEPLSEARDTPKHSI